MTQIKTDLQEVIEKVQELRPMINNGTVLSLLDEIFSSLSAINKSHTELAENYIKAKARLARVEDWAKQNLNASSGLFAILEKK